MLRSVKYGLHGAVVAGLIAAPVVWNQVDKSVHLTVDGKRSTVSTTASDVRGALADAGLRAGSHDLLAPSAGTKVKDGMDVVLRRGRLLHLSIDGARKDVWTTAPTVSLALQQLGYEQEDFVSVSRSRRLPLRPTAIEIRTPRVVTVRADGQQQRITTTEATVGDMLTEIGINPDADDRLSVPATTATRDGLVVTVERVVAKQVVRTETVKYDVTRTKSGKVYRGTTEVLKPGRNGKAQVTYKVVYVDGKATSQVKLSSKVVVAPRDKVVAVGTKEPTGPDGAQAIARSMLGDFGFGDDQFSCLVSMWNRESGWRTDAANPSGAYGIPQSLPGSKMASAGPDWQTDARTQIKWGLGYIKSRYGTPCGAWGFWQAHNYY